MVSSISPFQPNNSHTQFMESSETIAVNMIKPHTHSNRSHSPSSITNSESDL